MGENGALIGTPIEFVFVHRYCKLSFKKTAKYFSGWEYSTINWYVNAVSIIRKHWKNTKFDEIV